MKKVWPEIPESDFWSCEVKETSSLLGDYHPEGLFQPRRACCIARSNGVVSNKQIKQHIDKKIVKLDSPQIGNKLPLRVIQDECRLVGMVEEDIAPDAFLGKRFRECKL